MDLNLKGKRALVFGASSGLGLAVSAALAREGVRVAMLSRNQDKLEGAKKEAGGEHVLVKDLAELGAARNAVKEVIDLWGGLDILITNTGGPKRGNFSDINQNDWHSSYQSLMGSVLDSINAALPAMQAQGWGRILMITSFAAKEPMNGLIISNTYRAGLLGLAKSLSNEFAKFGITVNALLPGYTRTARVRETGVPEEKIAVNIPAGRFGEPSEFAALAAFLCGVPAAYITGQAIAVDGGYTRGL